MMSASQHPTCHECKIIPREVLCNDVCERRYTNVVYGYAVCTVYYDPVNGAVMCELCKIV